MGMRTAFISVVRVDMTEFNLGYKYFTQFFHNQWGYGKVMPMAFLSNLFKSYSFAGNLLGLDFNNGIDKKIVSIKETGDKVADFFKYDMTHSNYIDIGINYINTPTAQNFAEMLFNTPYYELAKNILSFVDEYFDNDCGAMVDVTNIRLTSTSTYSKDATIKTLDEVRYINAICSKSALFVDYDGTNLLNFKEYFNLHRGCNDDGRGAIAQVIETIKPIYGTMQIDEQIVDLVDSVKTLANIDLDVHEQIVLSDQVTLDVLHNFNCLTGGDTDKASFLKDFARYNLIQKEENES